MKTTHSKGKLLLRFLRIILINAYLSRSRSYFEKNEKFTFFLIRSHLVIFKISNIYRHVLKSFLSGLIVKPGICRQITDFRGKNYFFKIFLKNSISGVFVHESTFFIVEDFFIVGYYTQTQTQTQNPKIFIP